MLEKRHNLRERYWLYDPSSINKARVADQVIPTMFQNHMAENEPNGKNFEGVKIRKGIYAMNHKGKISDEETFDHNMCLCEEKALMHE